MLGMTSAYVQTPDSLRSSRRYFDNLNGTRSSLSSGENNKDVQESVW